MDSFTPTESTVRRAPRQRISKTEPSQLEQQSIARLVRATEAALGQAPPEWLIEHLHMSVTDPDRSAIDLREDSPDLEADRETTQVLSQASAIIRAHRMQPDGVQLLAMIAIRLAIAAEISLAMAATETAVEFWRQERLLSKAETHLSEMLEIVTGKTETGHQARGQLITLHANVLIDDNRPSDADAFLRFELDHPGQFQSLRGEATISALRSRAIRKLGDRERAHMLLVDAQSLLSDDFTDNGLLETVTLEQAVLDNDADLLRQMAARVGSDRKLPSPVRLNAKLGEAFVLLSEQEFDAADQVLAEIYTHARRQHLWDEAVRALAARGVVRCCDIGPDSRAISYFAHAGLLAEERSDKNLLAFVVASLGVTQMEAGQLPAAEQTIIRLQELELLGSDRFDALQFCTEASLAVGNLARAGYALAESDEFAMALNNSQDTGHQLRLWAEYRRRTGDLEGALAACKDARNWLQDSPNEYIRRSTYLESARSHRASGIPFPDGESYDSPGRHPAGVAFEAAIRAESRGDSALLLAAAELMDQANHRYEATQLLLSALRLSGTGAGLGTELIQRASSIGSAWIVEAAMDWEQAALAPDRPPVRQTITAREAQVLDLLTTGKPTNAIAAELFISPRTVSSHVSNVVRKLGAENRLEAIALWQGDQPRQSSAG